MDESHAMVNRLPTALAAPSRPRWLFRRLALAAPPIGMGRLRPLLREIATQPEDSSPFARYAGIATQIKGDHLEPSLSIGVTTDARRGNGHARTAVALAGLWARWEYSPLLVEVGGRACETGRQLRRTVPKIADVLTAIECGQHLPMPQPMTPSLPNLDVLADLGRFSLARLADCGLLREFDAALRERYQRLVWSLPAVGAGWSAAMFGGTMDRFVLSVHRGRTDRRTVEKLAAELADLHLHPLQMIWHQ